MSTNVTLHAGHDVAYFTAGQGCGGCAGAMSYYTAAGEPPGEWALDHGLFVCPKRGLRAST